MLLLKEGLTVAGLEQVEVVVVARVAGQALAVELAVGPDRVVGQEELVELAVGVERLQFPCIQTDTKARWDW